MSGRDPVPLDQLAMELVLYLQEDHVDDEIAFNMRQRILSRCDQQRCAELESQALNTLKMLGAIK
jgi:hypothetical protein